MSQEAIVLPKAWETKLLIDGGWPLYVSVESGHLLLNPASGSYNFVSLTDSDLIDLLMFAIDNMPGFDSTLRERMQDEYRASQ